MVVAGSSDNWVIVFPLLSVTFTVAWLVKLPELTSLCVSVCLATALILAPGANVAMLAGCMLPAFAAASLNTRLLNVVLPVLVMVKV
ncbi:hypothetical protein D3C73_814530 [compost metagenome]